MAGWLIGFRLSGYGAAYFFAAGAFMSYWPVWLRDRGMTDSQIGTLFMSRQLVSVLSTLAIGWAAHRLGNVRGVILVLAGAATFLLTGYQFSTTFLAILAVIGTLRDYFIAGSLMGLVVFAPGIALAIIDALLWAGLTALAITVMRAVSGPSRDDRLARRPGHPV